MSTWQIGKKQTESTRKKISDALKKKIELDPNWGKRTPEMLRGKKHTPEHNRRVSEGLKGKICSEETRKRIGDAQRGEKSRWWNGGSSYYPYCELFNNDFKIRARTYYNYTCVECGSYGNCVHHVHYDKKMCCNGSPQDVVVLCKSCHGKANFNRDYWEKYFTDMIYGYYQGKSFFTKEEMLKYRGLNMESV